MVLHLVKALELDMATSRLVEEVKPGIAVSKEVGEFERWMVLFQLVGVAEQLKALSK
jgi:hypothetical protein